MIISASEKKDFDNILQDAGFSVDDFEVIPHDTTAGGPGVHPITGTVNIRRTSNGKEKTYKAGHTSTWPTDFSTDLDQGYFGSPNDG